MQILLAHFNTAKESWHEDVVASYLKKIRQFSALEVHAFKIKKLGRDSAEAKKKIEAVEILAFLKPTDLLILFDENATALTSMEFSKKLNQWLMTGKKRIVFAIGGAYGFEESVKSRADFRISLSKMTMNHLVAQTVVLEQIYRAFAILNNLPYHNE